MPFLFPPSLHSQKYNPDPFCMDWAPPAPYPVSSKRRKEDLSSFLQRSPMIPSFCCTKSPGSPCSMNRYIPSRTHPEWQKRSLNTSTSYPEEDWNPRMSSLSPFHIRNEDQECLSHPTAS